jgi:hypothetical protein
MRPIYLLILSMFSIAFTQAQTLGGNSTYNFLRLPAHPLMSGAGGLNVSYASDDVGFALYNPSLLRASMDKQLHLSFLHLPGGIRNYALSGGYHHKGTNATFGGQVFFLDYGSLPQTDASGNISGTFRPVDFVVQASAAAPYRQKWNYGGTLKFIHSSYGQYRSSGIAADVAVSFEDSTNLFSASIMARNMGTQLTSYAGEGEDLPFDLQVGITKRLARSPLGFSLTAHHLHRFNLAYNDTVFNNENDLFSSTGTITKVLDHLVLATHIHLGKNLEAIAGYNFLRRRELAAGEGNGLTGFSVGFRARFHKLSFSYGRAAYQRNIATHHAGLTIDLRSFGKIDL